MEILVALVALVVGAAAGRLTAPKGAAADGAADALREELSAARRAQAAAETALREAEASPAAAAPSPAPATAAAGPAPDAEMLAAENAALRKALSAAEARAARAELG